MQGETSKRGARSGQQMLLRYHGKSLKGFKQDSDVGLDSQLLKITLMLFENQRMVSDLVS